MLPNFIGIGAPKCGTTWLFKCLQEHPQIFVARIKETKFFDEQNIEGRLHDYEKHFDECNGARAVGEISTRYLASSRAAERIKTYLPHARLFVSLRNPIDQVYSYYWHLRRQNFHQGDRRNSPHRFEDALEKYKAMLLGPAFYYEHLSRWLQHFDRSQVLILFYDDIFLAPHHVMQTLYSYLSVDNRFIPQSIHQNGASVRRGASPKGARMGQVHSFIYDHFNRSIYYPMKQILGANRAERLKNSLKLREIQEFLFLQKGYPQMPAEVRTVLRNYFSEDITRLQKLTGRDLSHWR